MKQYDPKGIDDVRSEGGTLVMLYLRIESSWVLSIFPSDHKPRHPSPEQHDCSHIQPRINEIDSNNAKNKL